MRDCGAIKSIHSLRATEAKIRKEPKPHADKKEKIPRLALDSHRSGRHHRGRPDLLRGRGDARLRKPYTFPTPLPTARGAHDHRQRTARSADSETARLPGGVRVSDVPVKAGDSVKAGDVLATLDLDSLRDQQLRPARSLPRSIARSPRAARVSSVNPPSADRVKYLPAQKGDDVLSVIGSTARSRCSPPTNGCRFPSKPTPTLRLYADVTVRWDGGSATGMLYEKTPSAIL
jgi:biotin carboxyl carrier protein